jgi:hypothetical protein
MGLALLAGLAVAEGSRRLRALRAGHGPVPALAGAALAALLVAAMYTQYAGAPGVPTPVPRAPLPATYPLAPAIAADTLLVAHLQAAQGPLLELPPGVDAGVTLTRGAVRRLAWPPSHARAMYRSIFHWRPLLNGYSSYRPDAFLDHMALASRLPDPEALAQLRRDTGVTTLLVHSAEYQPGRRQAWSAIATGETVAGLRLVARDGDDLLFTVVPQEP